MDNDALIFERHSGNSYAIRDSFVYAEVELLGGGDGMLIVLHSIKAIGASGNEGNFGIEALARYLAEQLIKKKRFGAFVIMHKNKILFSLDKGIKVGTQVTNTDVKQISAGKAFMLTFAQFFSRKNKD